MLRRLFRGMVVVVGGLSTAVAHGQEPTLALNATGGACCVGDTVTVTVDMGIAEDFIVSGQFFLEYDQTTLDFQSMDPGEAPFGFELYEQVDEGNGLIDYAIGMTSPGLPGSQGPVTMAYITFVWTTPGTPFVRFRPHNPPTMLGTAEAETRLPELIDLDSLPEGGAFGDVASPFANETPTTQPDLVDLACVLMAFEAGSEWSTVCPLADLMGTVDPVCGGDGGINLADIVAVVTAFAGDPACSVPCP